MLVQVDELVNGKTCVHDMGDDAPLVTIEFHNEYRKLKDEDKEAIALLVVNECAKRLGQRSFI